MSSQQRAQRRVQERNRLLGTPNADGSPLEGYVEYPVDGAEVQRACRVSGWHAWDKRPVATVVIEMDGAIIGRAVGSPTPRDDVAEDRDDPRYAETGWVVDLHLEGVQSQACVLTPTVYPAAEHDGVRLDPIAVVLLGDPTIDEHGEPIPPDNAVIGRLDSPARGSTVELGPVAVRGWARSTSSPISRVALRANGADLGLARIGLARHDVAAMDDAPDAPICGFEQLVDLGLAGELSGAIDITATAVALDGTIGDLSTEVSTLEAPRRREVDLALAPALQGPVPNAGPLNLLVFTHHLGYGGAQLWLHELLVRAGAGRAFPCTVVSFAGGELAEALEALGVEVHVSSPLPVDNASSYEGRLAELEAWLGDRRHTATLVNTFRSFPGADLAHRRGSPVVWAVHESWPEPLIWAFDHPGATIDPTVRAIAARALRMSGAVVFESEATRRLYEDRAPGRTIVVPYGVDTAAIDSFAGTTTQRDARLALGLAQDGRLLLVMGTVEPRKAQALIAEAFAQIAGTHPDANLAFVGDLHTAYSSAVAAFLERAGLSDRATLVPVTDDALTWYRASDVLVCGSDIESLPRSVLDAMCMGLPVVSTGVFGLAEMLRDGETAVLFEPADLEAAVQALDRVLSMAPGELARIARNGMALVHERHDSSSYVTGVMALLEGLQARPAARPAELLAAARPHRP